MSGVRIVVKGVQQLRAKAKAYDAKIKEGVARAIKEGAFAIEKTAKQLITDPKSGKSYPRPGGTDHVASAPGEAPASDTGNLRKNITTVITSEGQSASVVSRAPYSAYLEFGTRGDKNRNIPPLAPRPFMTPAVEMNRRAIDKAIRSAFLLKGGK